MDTDTWRFLGGAVGDTQPTAIFFAVEPITPADARASSTRFCVYYQDQWYAYAENPEWSAVAIAAVRYPGETQLVVAMSDDSSIWEMRPKERQERLSRIGDYTGMTHLANIGNAIYACGMGRIVLRREADGSWTDLSAPWPAQEEGVIGFTALAARDPQQIYAVGWQGEIWVHTAAGWSKEELPTDANLNAAVVTAEGEVYAVGDNGVLVRGRQGQWQLMDTGTDFNLTDICCQAGQIFISSDFDVYRLTPEGLVSDLIRENDIEGASCLKLVAMGDAQLVSIGPSDVFHRTDSVWYRIA